MNRALTLVALCAAVAGGFALGRSRGAAAEDRPKWVAFKLADLEERRAKAGDPWLEFFKASTLRTGLYALPAGAPDPQPVHAEDEVYHILKGRAVLRVDGEDQPVGPGSIVYVRAGVEHRFHSIAEDLEVLVFFAGS